MKAEDRQKSGFTSALNSPGIGTTAEKRTGRTFNARMTVGSGAFRQKSDGEFERKTAYYRFENKATEKKSFSVQREVLEKIAREARAKDQVPLLTFQFVDGQQTRPFGAWVALPEHEFERLLELLDG